MPDPKPVHHKIPEAGGGQKNYVGSGKLKGKKAVITGGDSGIGAASALLFAKESAEAITIAYLPEEEKDAQATKKDVEEAGAECHLISLDLSKQENCRKLIDFALEKMGGIDILFNNAACKCLPPLIWNLISNIEPRSNDGRRYQGSTGGAMDSYFQHQHSLVLLLLKVCY